MQTDLDAVVFDFGGVLIDVDYERTIDAFIELGIDNFDLMYSQAAQSKLFDEFETGKISAPRFINGLLPFLPVGVSPNAVVKAWNAMIGSVPYEGIQLLKSLRQAGIRTFLLSNTNELHIPIAFRRWLEVHPEGPNELFDKIYLSHEVGMRKPDLRIFELVCREQKLDPSRTLFIDDSEQHICGARKAGLQVLHLKRRSDLYTYFS